MNYVIVNYFGVKSLKNTVFQTQQYQNRELNHTNDILLYTNKKQTLHITNSIYFTKIDFQ